jgi:uncharacterized membrane protein YtjA (UPF0391 family)
VELLGAPSVRFSKALGEDRTAMLDWILIFLIIAAVASLIGLPRLAGASATAAQVLIFVALGALLIYLVAGIIAVA